MNAEITGHAVRSVWTRRDRTDALAQMASACRPTDDPAKPKQVSSFIIRVISARRKTSLSNMYFTFISAFWMQKYIHLHINQKVWQTSLSRLVRVRGMPGYAYLNGMWYIFGWCKSCGVVVSTHSMTHWVLMCLWVVHKSQKWKLDF